jgi:hypothetical protein
MTYDPMRSDDELRYQDPTLVSKRVWAGVSAAATAVLIDPSVQTALTGLLPAVVPAPYLPLATALIAAGLAAWSKASDHRPRRGSGDA